MIRVWGGGWYETDYFYDLCDKKGIIVWQDFAFANNLFPADDDFLKNIIEEVRDNLKVIRNHPSLGFFNGNNEVMQGWNEWGYSSLNQGKNKKLVWSWYQRIFE